MSEEKKVRLVVKSFKDKAYRHVVTGTEDGVGEAKAERVIRGLLHQMNTDGFYVDEEEV